MRKLNVRNWVESNLDSLQVQIEIYKSDKSLCLVQIALALQNGRQKGYKANHAANKKVVKRQTKLKMERGKLLKCCPIREPSMLPQTVMPWLNSVVRKCKSCVNYSS